MRSALVSKQVSIGLEVWKKVGNSFESISFCNYFRYNSRIGVLFFKSQQNLIRVIIFRFSVLGLTLKCSQELVKGRE